MSALPQYIEDAVEKAIFADAEVVIKDDGVFIKQKGGEVALARAITRDLKFSDVFKANEIRDLAARITMKHIPPVIWEPKTPEDYTKMYTTGPKSCMSYPPGSSWASYCPAYARDIYEKTGIWSSSFYAYVPEIQGSCMMIEDKIVTRSFILPMGLLGQVYGEQVHTQRHIEHMETKCNLIYQYGSRGGGKYPWFVKPFKVPSIDSKTAEGTVVPIPNSIDFSLMQHYRLAFCKQDEHVYFEPAVTKEPKLKHGIGFGGGSRYHFHRPTSFHQIEKPLW